MLQYIRNTIYNKRLKKNSEKNMTVLNNESIMYYIMKVKNINYRTFALYLNEHRKKKSNETS